MLKLEDKGKASKMTRGFIVGSFWEGGTPPYIWFTPLG